MNPLDQNAYTASNNLRTFYMPISPWFSPWIQNPVIQNPLCFPGTAFTNGSPCFPYSSAPSDYPAFPVSLYPWTTRYDQRPVVPMSCHIAQIQPCNGFGERNQTTESQTGSEQARNTSTNQDTQAQAISHDEGIMTSIPSAVDTDTKNIPRKTGASSVAPERLLHGVGPDHTLNSNMPITSASEEKRVGRGSGAPARAFCEAFKESIHLYDLAYGSVPEKVQPDVFQHCSESQGLLGHLSEGEDITNTDEQRGAGLWEQHLEVEEEDRMSGVGVEVNLGQKVIGCGTDLEILPTTNKGRDEVQLTKSQNNVIEKECESRAVGQLQQKQLCFSMGVENLTLLMSAQENLSEEKREPGSPKNHCHSPTPLAQGRKVITVMQLDVKEAENQHQVECVEPKVCKDKECQEYLKPHKLKEANNEGHGKSKSGGMCPESTWGNYGNYDREKANSKVSEPVNSSRMCSENSQELGPLMSGYDEEAEFYEEEDDIEMCNELPYEEQIDMPSPKSHFLHDHNEKERTRIQLDKGIQCGMRDFMEAMQLKADCDYLENREDMIMVETSSVENVCSPAPGLAQSNRMKFNQADQRATEKAHAAVAQHSLREEAWPNSPATVCSRTSKSSGKEKMNRKYKRDEEMVSGHLTNSSEMKNVESWEAKATALFPNRRTICMLKRHPRFNILVEDLEDSEDDEVYEIDGLFQEIHAQDTLIFHKCRIFQEIGSAKPLKSEGPVPPLLSVSYGGKKGESKLGACENIPQAYQLETEEGCETIYVGCPKKPTKPEESQFEIRSSASSSWSSFDEVLN